MNKTTVRYTKPKYLEIVRLTIIQAIPFEEVENTRLECV